MKELKNIFAGAVAASASAAATVGVTLWGDLSAPFKAWLAGFTGHHWVTKSWLAIIIFVAVFAATRLLAKNPGSALARRALWVLFGVLSAGVLVLLGFYIFEFFKH